MCRVVPANVLHVNYDCSTGGINAICTWSTLDLHWVYTWVALGLCSVGTWSTLGIDLACTLSAFGLLLVYDWFALRLRLVCRLIGQRTTIPTLPLHSRACGRSSVVMCFCVVCSVALLQFFVVGVFSV